MLRTRDFVLLFTVIVFLVVALGATVVNMLWPQTSVPSQLIPAEPIEAGGAETPAPLLDRAARAESLREKIAASSDLYLSQPPQTDITVPTPEPPSPETTIMEPLLCGNYMTYASVWPSKAIVTTVAEGVRVYSTTAVVGSTTVATTLLTTPVYPIPTIPYCLPNDVIGIALDGSLIRNNEGGLYGIFGPDTLIGYALDGFPIYGQSTAPLDECGGSQVGSGYRYQAAVDRAYIIACFSAAPAPLP